MSQPMISTSLCKECGEVFYHDRECYSPPKICHKCMGLVGENADHSEEYEAQNEVIPLKEQLRRLGKA